MFSASNVVDSMRVLGSSKEGLYEISVGELTPLLTIVVKPLNPPSVFMVVVRGAEALGSGPVIRLVLLLSPSPPISTSRDADRKSLLDSVDVELSRIDEEILPGTSIPVTSPSKLPVVVDIGISGLEEVSEPDGVVSAVLLLPS